MKKNKIKYCFILQDKKSGKYLKDFDEKTGEFTEMTAKAASADRFEPNLKNNKWQYFFCKQHENVQCIHFDHTGNSRVLELPPEIVRRFESEGA